MIFRINAVFIYHVLAVPFLNSKQRRWLCSVAYFVDMFLIVWIDPAFFFVISTKDVHVLLMSIILLVYDVDYVFLDYPVVYLSNRVSYEHVLHLYWEIGFLFDWNVRNIPKVTW